VPFDRLDLVKASSTRLSVVVHCRLPMAVGVIKSPRLYGAIYQRSRTPHTLSGTIHLASEPDFFHIEIDYRREDWGRPPKGYTNPDELWSFLSASQDPIRLEGYVVFKYAPDLPSNELQLPLKLNLPLPEGIEAPFTHVTGVTVAKLSESGDDLIHSLAMSNTGDGLHHTVTYSRQFPSFGDQVIQQILEQAQHLSCILVPGKAQTA